MNSNSVDNNEYMQGNISLIKAKIRQKRKVTCIIDELCIEVEDFRMKLLLTN